MGDPLATGLAENGGHEDMPPLAIGEILLIAAVRFAIGCMEAAAKRTAF